MSVTQNVFTWSSSRIFHQLCQRRRLTPKYGTTQNAERITFHSTRFHFCSLIRSTLHAHTNTHSETVPGAQLSSGQTVFKKTLLS